MRTRTPTHLRNLRSHRKRNRRTPQRRADRPRSVGLTGLVSWAVGVVGLFGTAVGVRYGWECVRTAGRLQLSTIEVLGTARTRWSEVEVYTGVHVGDPILDIDLDTVAQNLRRHPWIRDATVKRRLPNHLTIEVVEHIPQILVSAGGVYLANESGELFKRVSSGDRVTLPILTGLRRADITDRPDQTSALIREAIVVATAVESSGLARLEELRWDHDLGWSMVIIGHRGFFEGDERSMGSAQVPATVHLGKQPIEALGLTARALRRLRELRRLPLELWADGHKHPGRVQVRFRRIDQNYVQTLSTANASGKAGH